MDFPDIRKDSYNKKVYSSWITIKESGKNREGVLIYINK